MKPPPLHRQQGISLMESLVAMLVVALGLLGVLGLQMRNLADTRDSLHRSQASRLIQDLSERLRSQPQAIALAADGAFHRKWENISPGSESSCRTGACATGECSPTQLVSYELSCWQSRVAAQLPSGQALLFTSSDRKQLGVMITWKIDPEPSQSLPPGPAAGMVTIVCPEGHRCHLQYIHLIQRQLPEA